MALAHRLVERGYVTRHADPGDRRKVLVRIEPPAYAGFARIYPPCGQQALIAITEAVTAQARALRTG